MIYKDIVINNDINSISNISFIPIIDFKYLNGNKCENDNIECNLSKYHYCLLKNIPHSYHLSFISCYLSLYQPNYEGNDISFCLNYNISKIDVDNCINSNDVIKNITNSMNDLSNRISLPYITVRDYEYNGEKPLDLMICDSHLVDQLPTSQYCESLFSVYGHSIIFKKLHPPRYNYVHKKRRGGRRVRHDLLRPF